MKKNRKRNGFTLIELIVVIAILGILAAIAVPRVGAFRAQAQEAAYVATARTIASAVNTYKVQEGDDKEPAVADLSDYISDLNGTYVIGYDGNHDITSITTPGGPWVPGSDKLSEAAPITP